MTGKPSYEELENRIRVLETEKARLLRTSPKADQEANAFVQLFELAPVPMAYASEADGFKATTWNAAWYQTFGYSPNEAQGKSGKEVGIWVKTEDRVQLIEIANQKNQITDFETRLSRADGKLLDCSLFGRFIQQPRHRLLMVIYFDITQRKQMEKIMMQSEKMLSLGGLAAGMAHEINNPLAGMIQTANVLSNRLEGREDIPANVQAAKAAGTTPGTIQAYMEARGVLRMLSTIRETGKRVSELVENMLNFVRKSNGALSSHDPAQLVEDTLALAGTDYDLKTKFDFKTIQIARHYDAGLPMVPCHGTRIQQVLLNILRNGAQAMQERAGQQPGYQPEFHIRLGVDPASGMLRMAIQDNGPGMDETTSQRIFDPFFTTKPVGRGTGLGLSISYFIITENHNGKLLVESTVNAGSTFIILLPLHPPRP